MDSSKLSITFDPLFNMNELGEFMTSVCKSYFINFRPDNAELSFGLITNA